MGMTLGNQLVADAEKFSCDLQSNTLEGEHGGADQERERISVEHDDIGYTVLGDRREFVGRDVDN